MSARDARNKTTAAEAAESRPATEQPAAQAAGGDAALALFSAAPAGAQAGPQERDEQHGHGGLYVMTNGRRQLVERSAAPEQP